MSVPPRLADFPYIGLRRYSLTLCARHRRPVLNIPPFATTLVSTVLATARAYELAVLVYCVMPDHVHLAVEATREDADLRRYASMVKQRTGYAYRRACGDGVWQPGYYDRVLRDDEDILQIVRYVLANPVRAGLVRQPLDYPWSGSSVWNLKDLIATI